MGLVSTPNVISDLFRLSYQTVEAINQNRPASTLAERIGQTMKDHIALLDTFFTVGEYANDLALSAWLIPFRLGVIAQGIYRLQCDPNADTYELTQDILINLMNISKVAVSRFSQTTALFLAGADVSLRLGSMLWNRGALIDRFNEITDRSLSDNVIRTSDLLIAGANYLFRAAVVYGLIGYSYFRGLHYLDMATQLPAKTLNEIIGWTAAGCALSLFIAEAVKKVFDDFGLQPSPKRRFAELSISTISSAALMSAIAVGLKRVESFSQIFKPIQQAVLTTTIACTIGYLFKTAAGALLDAMSVPDGIMRSIEEWSFTIISAIALTTIATAGIGITSNIADSMILITQIGMVALGTSMVCHSIIKTCAITISGIYEWKDIINDNWFYYIF